MVLCNLSRVDICLHRSVPKHEVFYLVSRPTSKMSILSEVKSWTSTIIGAADDILEPNNILIYLHCDPIIYTKSRDVNYTKLRIGIVLKSQESGYYFSRVLDVVEHSGLALIFFCSRTWLCAYLVNWHWQVSDAPRDIVKNVQNPVGLPMVMFATIAIFWNVDGSACSANFDGYSVSPDWLALFLCIGFRFWQRCGFEECHIYIYRYSNIFKGVKAISCLLFCILMFCNTVVRYIIEG